MGDLWRDAGVDFGCAAPAKNCAGTALRLYYLSVNLNTKRRAQVYKREPYFYFLAMGAVGTSSPWHSMQFIWAVMP
jgi:hypothetical protein